MRLILFFGAGVIAVAALGGEPVRLASGPTQTALIELFTSEGCSSCPPAERWLAALRDAPGLWRDFVPVAWHVDYWNRLGWPDRFSTREFTQREYDYAAAWSSGSVYTPCFVRNGIEWREAGAPAPDPTVTGRLTVDYDGRMLHARFSPARPRAGESFEIHAAILGGGIASRVTAGENNGAAITYNWKRADFPWTGIWEENHSRKNPPWNAVTLTRGMEFGVSPIPESRREMIDRRSLFGVPAYRWLPAKGELKVDYRVSITSAPPEQCRETRD